ncbi:PREDICTED: protoheme IX farnesyltransferase, mitochondrial isoform X1 [Polistes dominula]|uniref:Protoheme IX farnesyltransferase, mitochondrial n=2 Tax=Polistes dominula TaxID=743375 RepID=A0ABM1HUN7_POLDO|nr:PREDICTED: protoheme IX farnesyltransferase, mitochondrial isoform X1 [Polistes dominula]
MMLYFFTPRICRNLLPCTSTSKLLTTLYSTCSKQKSKEVVNMHESCIEIREKNYNHISPANTQITLDPDKYVLPKTSSPNSNKETTRPFEEPQWKPMQVEFAHLHKYCLKLSKIRLTSLVVITTMGGYAIAPGMFDLYTFTMCSVGTALVSSAANAVNQFFEVPFDAQMSRTKNRVLVRGQLTPVHAVLFATLSGVTGLTILYSQVNPITAMLGAINLVLYTLIYTPMKRISILNTWVGSIVGAIPPLMGWAGCTGDIMAPGAWIMSGLLYAWQFPHFNALSWNLRPDYSRAGYRMMSVTNPNLCRKTALRYTAALMGLSYLAPVLDVTNWYFAAMSTPLNSYFLYLAWKFYQNSDSASSRKLFRFSLVYLPVLMILLLVNKKYWFIGKKKTDTVTNDENYQKETFLSNLSRLIIPTTSSV